MNKTQLEQILQKLKEIETLIDTDTTTMNNIQHTLDDLYTEVTEELKELIWQDYKTKQQP